MISAIHDSPVGPLTLKSNGKALTHCEFENPRYASPDARNAVEQADGVWIQGSGKQVGDWCIFENLAGIHD